MIDPKKVAPFTIHPQARIGHVHLKVADLQRALRFYSEVLGFEVTQRYGEGAVSSSHRTEHLGQPGRIAASAGNDRALPYCDSLSHQGSAG